MGSTSGTTSGINKGVRISSRSLITQALAKTNDPCYYNKNTNMLGSLCIPPFFHIGGISSILSIIFIGGCLIFPLYDSEGVGYNSTNLVLSCLSNPFRKKNNKEYINTLVVVPTMLHSITQENQKQQPTTYP